ncbi:MAG: acyl carrier protein [Peptostreptococcaceae bacterium]|nr:acyl carrier protein [Peptostreptococcaceae bacterium]
MFERVRAVLADKLSKDEAEIKLESNIKEDLGADSLDMVEVIMGLEDEFEIEIPEEDAANITTVGEIVKYLEGKVA